ncbi:signal transduction histidine kinase [Pleurocapsa sp. PCC 7327]|uniref:hybrid sensor histidine kinase/response regulator n=1 Tax=Pleurocapsa sp. PCC 7327 TaxID=118163 RepID=UPI00029FD1C6|nr:signal transduction histidine kinase [Pleurocapsa sp. PCC 7327]
MDNSQTSILRRTVSSDTYERLCSLWQQMAERKGQENILLTEETLFPVNPSFAEKEYRERFFLLFSPEFRALLTGRLRTEDLLYQISIIWDTRTIADFVDRLSEEIGQNTKIQQLRDLLQQTLIAQPSNNPDLQCHFTLKLLDILTPETLGGLEQMYPRASICKPVEDALHQQVTQERLLNQVITQIRQSLELPVILETAVKEVRSFLQVDRLVIYQFINESSAENERNHSSQSWGRVTYESRASDRIPSILNLTAEDDCFTYIPRYTEKYRRGLVVAIEDVEKAYSSSFCLVELLRQRDVKAKLIAPIVVEEKLWGLLIAHQCFETRQWFESEKNFLRQIGEHLAVAIYQAQLYAEVQQQKNTFEQRVIERTQELRDTLLAAQSAHQSKSEFLGNMSHELRTPLTSVIGLSGTLLHWSDRGSALSLAKQRQYLKMIQDSGKQLLELINEILDFSQLEAGKLFLNTKEFSLQNLSRKVLKNLQTEATNQQIHLELDCRVESRHDRFYADPDRIQQILFHLIKNAIKFTPADGTVILRVWKENNYAVFQVEDTGIGISEDQLPLLFEKFQQLEKSRQRTHGGTGLGLALTKQLVELHRGTIEVESTVGKGSLFTVRLPNQSHRQLKTTPASKVDDQISSESKSIVLIERDEEVATLMCELLTAATYQVVWLIDSTTAIGQIELLCPSLAIVDRNIPDVYHISKTLKKLQTTKSIKILLLSDKITLTDWQALSRKGIDDYLPKPIQPHLLLQRVSALVSSDKNSENDKMKL